MHEIYQMEILCFSLSHVASFRFFVVKTYQRSQYFCSILFWCDTVPHLGSCIDYYSFFAIYTEKSLNLMFVKYVILLLGHHMHIQLFLGADLSIVHLDFSQHLGYLCLISGVKVFQNTDMKLWRFQRSLLSEMSNFNILEESSMQQAKNLSPGTGV